MSTRGCYGFRKNGIDKITYNHYDSYPDWLGRHIASFCKETSIDEMNEIFDKIVLVDERSIPNADQIKECIEYFDGSVSRQSEEDWYCLLRNAQGNLNVYKNGLRYMIDSHDFISDSLFCEYAYIINLDTKKLEFWKGFQEKPDKNNRYGTESDRGYYPCKMVKSYSLLPRYMKNRDVDQMVEEMDKKR